MFNNSTGHVSKRAEKYLKMIENEVRCDKNAEMKCGTELMTKGSSMKNGLHQKINNVVHCYQTPLDVAVILEQVSNCNDLLREQMNRNMLVSKSCATANEHAPKEAKDKNTDKDCKIEKDERWIKPEKYMPMEHFSNHATTQMGIRRMQTSTSCWQTTMRTTTKKKMKRRRVHAI